MSLAIITDDGLAALKTLREFAEANPVSLALIRELAATPNAKPLVETEPRYAIELPINIRICFSIEDHPSGRFRHISISNGKKYVVPLALALQLVAYLGFTVPENVPEEDALQAFEGVWTESYGQDYYAVNLVQKL